MPVKYWRITGSFTTGDCVDRKIIEPVVFSCSLAGLKNVQARSVGE
jgi:hypothetical protein